MTAMYLLTAVPATAQREGESARPRALERLAILPFNNMSGQPSDDWIGAGIAETVTADFEALGALTVIAQERVRAVAARRGEAELDDAAVTALGRELDARWVVVGGYQRLGGQLRITARLVDTTSGLIA